MKNETNDKDIVALEIMSEAENYTSYIYSLLLKNIYKKNVLDFGSGYGDFCNFLNDKNFNVSGFEPNELAFKKSLNYGFEVFNNYEKIIKKYNTITSINVLEHIEDDNAALQQIKSLMNNDSRLILYLPASMKIWSQMDVDANHFRRYTKKDISEKLVNSGFIVESIEFVDFVGWLVLIIFKFFKIKPQFNKKLIIFYDKYIFRYLKILDYFFKKLLGKNILIVASLRSP